jgi:hypothetical protein
MENKCVNSFGERFLCKASPMSSCKFYVVDNWGYCRDYDQGKCKCPKAQNEAMERMRDED